MRRNSFVQFHLFVRHTRDSLLSGFIIRSQKLLTFISGRRYCRNFTVYQTQERVFHVIFKHLNPPVLPHCFIPLHWMIRSSSCLMYYSPPHPGNLSLRFSRMWTFKYEPMNAFHSFRREFFNGIFILGS